MAAPVQYPAPERYKVNWLRQLIGLFGAPTVWAMQMMFSEALASYACYPHQTPLAVPMWHWLHQAIAGISVACFAAAAFSAWIAWIDWRRSRPEEKGGEKRTIEVGEGRTRFLALVSLYSSALFLIAILLTAFAVLLVSPCQNWF